MPATTPSTAPLMQQMEDFQKAFLRAFTAPAQGVSDEQISPRAAYQGGCTAMKKLTDQALALQQEWINTLEQANGAAGEAGHLNALPVVNQYLCQSARDAINTRARLWELTYQQLQSLEPMVPDGHLPLGGTQATSWHEFVSTLLSGSQPPASGDQEGKKGAPDDAESGRAAS